MSPVAWSLSCEAFFYVSFPLLIGPLSGLARRGRRRVQAALLLGIVFAAVLTHVTGISWFSSNLPLFRSFDFLLGATVALDIGRGEPVGARIGFRPAMMLTAAALVLGGVGPAEVLDTSVIPIVPFLLVLGAAARRDLDGRGTVFSKPALVWAGTVSFAFYLVHQPIVRMVDILTPAGVMREASGLPLAAVALALAVLGSWGVHVGVERPLERRLRGRTRHRGPITVVPARDLESAS